MINPKMRGEAGSGRSPAAQELMNKVTEARKEAEANLIARREETAAMRRQANTAKLLANNPTLMRLRELEILSKALSGSRASLCAFFGVSLRRVAFPCAVLRFLALSN